MAGPYFGGAPNAFMGGAAFSTARRAQRLQENALNAMIQRFGPEAADPVALSQLENIQQRRELHPYDVAAAQRQQTAQEALTGQYGPIAGDPSAVAVEGVQQNARRRAALGAATVLQNVKQKGGDMGAAFDRLASILPAIGIPSDQLPGIKNQILANPDMVDELIAMLQTGDPNGAAIRATGNPIPVYDEQGNLRLMQQMSDGTTKIVPGVTPASSLQAEARLGQGNRRLDLSELRMYVPTPQPGVTYSWAGEPGNSAIIAEMVEGSPQAREEAASQREAIAEAAQAIQSARTTVIAPAERVQENGKNVLAYIEKSPWFRSSGSLSAQARAAATTRLGRGTDPWEAAQMLETIKANIGFSQLSNMTRGLGAVSERELLQLESVLGRLSVDRDPELLKRDIQEVMRLHADIVKKTQEEVQRREEEMRRLQNSPVSTSTRAPGSAGTSAPSGPSLDDLLNQYAPQ